MGKKIDVNNLIVETELSIWTCGLAAMIQGEIEFYLQEGYSLTDIENLAEYIAVGLKEEQGNREVFSISTHVDHYRADTI